MRYILIFFHIVIYLICCTPHHTYNLKLEYLDELVREELRKAETYKVRTDNSDLLGNLDGHKNPTNYGEFDFIVVGAGCSGSVVASRLSEIANWTVLLLEAGDVDDDFTDIPYAFDSFALSDRSWGYLTVPQKNGCFGKVNNECPYTRGKVLGGTGIISGLVYSRGMKKDFDKWAEQGNVGWAWKDVLPFFKKLENFESEDIDLRLRGTRGPVNAAYANPSSPYHKAFVAANNEIGIPYTDDYNGETTVGVSRTQHNIKDGKRVSGANAYVRPAWSRFNFNVTLQAFVTKILIDERTKTAYGVEFVKNGVKYNVSAKREVIISGGSINSAQLLMLSGLGPKSELHKHRIKLIQNLPVGVQAKDHVGIPAIYFKSNKVEPTLSNQQLISSYLEAEGLYTDPTGYKSVSYYDPKDTKSTNANIEIQFTPPSPIELDFPAFSNNKEETNEFMKGINKSTTWNFQLFLLHPQSLGTVKLKSADPKDFPLIDSKIFDNKKDLEAMYEGINVALKIPYTSVGKAFNLTLDLKIPFCHERYNSKAYWYCAMKHLAEPALHLCSTTKMGLPKDSSAVVNNELKVYGIKNLRVVDSGIVPSTVTGHMGSVAFLIGEKGADLIKKDHLK